MITVDVRSNIGAVIKSMEAIAEKHRPPAIARALNRAAVSVRAEASRRIRERYNLRAGTVNRELTVSRASPSRLVAVVRARGKPVALAEFNARQSKAKKVKGQVTVQVLRAGGRKVVRGNPRLKGKPFIATMKSGHVGIFQRVDKSRLPIRELFSISVPKAMSSRAIENAIRKVAFDRFTKEFRREIAFRSAR